ncbi:MAG TPA: cell wall-binding repeat-containing protein [Solirubrobacterales bacterium]|nr:cell wall-binding repeat-containing protein [Solirubrobacterales bacterium]
MPRPINADLPSAAELPTGEATREPDSRDRVPLPPGKRRRRRRRSVPGALKAIGGLFALAIVFVVAAILGGGSAEESDVSGPAPAPVPPAAEQPGESDRATTAEQLGFPAFATSNTTRVGGSDPASNAAAVALAVYPSTEEALRPSAVSLVDTANWQAAIAASVLMAEPVRAPLLLGEAGGLAEPTAAAFDTLDPQGNPESRGAQVFSIGAAAAPEGLETRAIEPAGPAATAVAIARLRERLVDQPPQHLIVASADRPEFAMPAAAWAARSGDPVLFTGPRRLPKATAAALRRYREARVYVLGPSSVISSDVVRQIGRIGDGQVRRVSGEDPVANAIALARYADGNFGWNVNDPGHGFVLARADSPLDAAAASALSASGTWGPLLLTDSADTLPAALRGYLLDVKPGYTTDPTRAFYNHVWVIGDQEAIDVNQQAQIDALAELAKIGGEG